MLARCSRRTYAGIWVGVVGVRREGQVVIVAPSLHHGGLRPPANTHSYHLQEARLTVKHHRARQRGPAVVLLVDVVAVRQQAPELGDIAVRSGIIHRHTQSPPSGLVGQLATKPYE